MAYLVLIVTLVFLGFFIQEVKEQLKTKVLNIQKLLLKFFLILVCVIGGNYINNKFLAEHKVKPYVKELPTKVYQEPLKDTSLKPMPKEERQERTDTLIDRNKITRGLYNE